MTSLLVLAAAASPPCPPLTLEVLGLRRLERTVVEELLPAPPACVGDAEVEELERRLWTMGLFDAVSVAREGGVLRVSLREKWTLAPSFDLATSRTVLDSFFFLSLVELNAFGRALELGGYVMWSERNPSFEVWVNETWTSARRFSLEGSLSSVGSSIFFEDSPFAWHRRWWGASVSVRTPASHGTQWRFAVGADVSHERSNGELPPGVRTEGLNVGLPMRATWDTWEWHDLTPSGTRFSVELTPTLFVSARDVTHRHGASTQLLHAMKLGAQTALLTNAVAEVAWWGDPNNTLLLGNVAQWRSYGPVGGVRGLPDNLYRTAAHGWGNLEFRRAILLVPTLFLQPAVFVDGGVMVPVDARGTPGAVLPVLSAGAGLRLVWTTLAGLVPRVDGGALLLPSRTWFVTFGLSQYF